MMQVRGEGQSDSHVLGLRLPAAPPALLKTPSSALQAALRSGWPRPRPGLAGGSGNGLAGASGSADELVTGHRPASTSSAAELWRTSL